MDFVDGPFYSGAIIELDPAAVAIGRFHALIGEIDSSLSPPKKRTYLPDGEAGLWAEVEQRRQEWVELFGMDHGRLLEENWELVSDAYRRLRRERSRIKGRLRQPCHGDIHPHNMLMQADQTPVFLDFESIVLVPREAAIGYGTYKLLKQHVVATGVRDASSVRRRAAAFTARIAEAYGVPLDPGDLGLFAIAELMRRVAKIFHLTVRKRDTSWNHVLPMHVAGLREIHMLFDLE